MARTQPSNTYIYWERESQFRNNENAREDYITTIDCFVSELQEQGFEKLEVSETDLKVRKCAICEKEMMFVEYLDANEVDNEQLEQWWLEDRIMIACCRCIMMINNILAHQPKFENGYLYYHDCDQLLTEKEIKNLQKWGIIE